MPRAVKWILAALAAVVVVVIAAMIVAILVIDVNQYKPQIQEQVAKATGRPFALEGDIKLSVFPWIGVTLSDAHLGNPPDFKDKDMVGVEFFEVRVRLLPLLGGNVEVKRFVLKGAKVNIIKQADGRFNFEGIPPAKDTARDIPEKPGAPAAGTAADLPIKGLQVGEFAIIDGSLAWVDEAAQIRKEVKQINLTLADVSLDKPVRLDFSAMADNRPVTLNGTLGPLGPSPGKSPVNISLVLNVARLLQTQLDGRVELGGQQPQFDITAKVAPFSARRLLDEFGQALPFEPADAEALKKIALDVTVSGSAEAVAIQKGLLTLDDSRMNFDARAKDFDKPDIFLSATLDRIDVDRYLPPPSETQAADTTAKPGSAESGNAPIDYAPFRKLVLDSSIKVGELKVKNVRTQNIDIRATARNGILRMNPAGLDLYSGTIQMDGTFNLQGQTPQNTLSLNMTQVQVGALLKDFLNKELIEGAASAGIKLTFSGDQPDRIRRTLNGNGELKFNDGAIVGIDLAGMVRNVQAAFGGQGQPAQKPRTDFSELVVPLTIQNGLANIDGSRLNSPLMRVSAGGKAHVAEETLDLRIDPKFVATLTGQGDTVGQRSGITVPILVTGTFAKPKFAPDLKSMLPAALPDQEKITREVEATKQKVTEDLQKKTQDVLKGLPFGGSRN